MKEKLQKLKAIEPTEETLRSIKARIDSRISSINKEEKIVSPYVRSPYTFTLMAYSMATFALVFSFTFYDRPTIEHAILSTRINLSSNAHTGSRLALSVLETNSSETGRVLEDRQSYERVRNTIATSRDTLDTLQLMGEKGKYTLEECLGDYEIYYKTLTKIETSLNTIPAPQDKKEEIKLQVLKDEVSSAKEEAEERLEKYPENS